MADDKEKKDDESKQDEESKAQEGESGLGNLPPLSDFDSGSGFSSDSGLPPLSSFESHTSDSDAGGGLPPLSDIDVETPSPTGGNIRATPPGTSSGPSASAGFQDANADSDFSPETPEIGPGPDSDANTSAGFDSAFGGGGGFDQSVDTPAPTQAMGTPMFGGTEGPQPGGGRDQGFDPNAFGGDFGAFGGGQGGFGDTGGTPAPNFEPDTGMGGGAMSGPPSEAPQGGGGGGRMNALVLVAAVVIALLGGVVGGQFLTPYLTFLPNPMTAEIDRLQGDVTRLQAENRRLTAAGMDETPTQISPEERDRLIEEVATTREQLNALQLEADEVQVRLSASQEDLRLIDEDIAERSEEFVTLQEQFEDLRNETSIVQAQQRGLAAEVTRLTGLVGELEEAHTRASATKGALEHAVDRLYIQVREGLPLTPARYAHDQRLAAVEQLREQVGRAPYVTPDLQDAYTSLYLQELEIASKREYFYARIPVTNRYNVRTYKWAECLMMGNWGVYYRTLDGRNIGTFENVSDTESPVWRFREDLPGPVRAQIEAEIIANRPADFESKVAALAEREMLDRDETPFQRIFSSL